MEAFVFADWYRLSPEKPLENLENGNQVTTEEAGILDERIRDLETNPEDEVPWEFVREHLESRRR
jgi:hypothetical protein